MSSPTLDLFFVLGAFTLAAVATFGLAYFARAARALFAAPGSLPSRAAPWVAMEDGALAAWEGEGGARASR